MSAIKLHISYCGLVQQIDCPQLIKHNYYEDIIESVMKLFSLPDEYKEALLFSNGGDCTLNKQSFEYYLQLFPCPESTFSLRLDYSKLKNSPAPTLYNKIASTTGHGERRIPFKKITNIQSSKDQSNNTYMAVPVHRQNCFIGSWPEHVASTSAIQSTTVSYSKHSTKRRANRITKKYKSKTTQCSTGGRSIRL